MDLIQEYVHKMSVQQMFNLEQTIINFLRKEGYEVSDNPTPQEVKELQKTFEREGKRLRVEVFMKWSGKCTITSLALPFFEPVDQEISRVEIYRMLSLARQGYQI